MPTPQHYMLRPGDTPDEVVLQLRGTIGWSCDLRNVSAAMDEAEAGWQRVVVEGHSPGGDVGEGWAIHNRLQKSKMDTVFRVVGIVASITTIIMNGCKRVEMARESLIMIHEPWAWGSGTAAQLRKTAKLLDQVTKILAANYQRRTGLEEAEIRRLMGEETWFTPEEALRLKFIDAIEGEGDATAVATHKPLGKEGLQALVRAEMERGREPKPAKEVNNSQFDMDLKFLAVSIGLAATATFEDVLNKFKEKDRDNAALARRVEVAESALRAHVSAEVDGLIAAAIAEGRVTAAETADLKALGEHDVRLLRTALNARPTAAQLIPGFKASGAIAGDRADWKLIDWMQKDPEGLAALQSTDPAAHAAILKR